MRKDVERAFGVLQARFATIRLEAKLWKRKDLNAIMKACIIMHNMIIEDERVPEDDFVDRGDHISQPTTEYEYVEVREPDTSVSHQSIDSLKAFLQRRYNLRNREGHFQLQHDLIEQTWSQHGDNE